MPRGAAPRQAVYPEQEDHPHLTATMTSSSSRRSKSVSTAYSQRGDPRWTSLEWEPRTLHGSTSVNKGRSVSSLVHSSRSTRKMTSGPALRRVDPSAREERGSISHERPRPISTGRLHASSSSSRNSDIVHAARTQHRDIRRQKSSSSSINARSSQRDHQKEPTSSYSPQTTDATSDTTTSTALREPPSDSPRSNSTTSVSKAFREMREKRDLQQQQQQQGNNNTHKKATQRRLRSQSLVDTELVVEQQEEQATRRLKQAEGKISSLMQELDELKFFSEIEAASPSPQKTPNSLHVAIHAPFSSSHHNANSSTELVLRERPTTTLSPRRLAGMDRTSLELEAQQLQRQVDILEREKATLEATVDMQDATATSRQDDVKRMLQLETKLQSLQQELATLVQQVETGRTKLTQLYQEQLQACCREKEQEAKEAADELVQELQESQLTLEKLEKKYSKSKEEAMRKLQEQSTTFQEAQQEWEARIQEKEEQVSKLEQELVEATMALEVTQTEQEESHAAKVKELQESMDSIKKERDSLETKLEELQTKLDETLISLEEKVQENESSKSKLAEVTSRLERIETDHAAELAELKNSLEDREKRRLDDLVVLQQDSNKEYERRLQALQEQLTLQTDRHETEMQTKETEFKVKLENELEKCKLSVKNEFESQLKEARAETARIQLKYEEAKQESLITQVKSESKDRDAAREWERKDAIRQGELEIMHDKLDRTMRELAEREAKIQQLQEKLSDNEQRKSVALVELEQQHAEEIAAREELLASQRQLWKASEAKLRTELARKDSDLMTQLESMDSNTGELKRELEDTRKELDEAKKKLDEAETLKHKLAVKQTSFEQLQKDLISEQARHESAEEDLRVQLAKLEGRLSATETTLVEKKLLVDDLEQRLSAAMEESSSVGSKFETKIISLKAELESARNSLMMEQSNVADKESVISKLENDRKENLAKLERMSVLEKSVSTLQRALSEVQAEKDAQAEEIEKLMDDRKRDVDSLDGTARQIAVEKDELSKLLEEKDKSIKELTESHAAAIAKLESRLDEEGSTKASLLSEVERLKESLETSNRVSDSRGQDSTHFQERINELEEQIAEQKRTLARNVSGSQETVAQLRKQLADAQKAQQEVAETLESLSNEKDEVVDALEQVLNEVQGRDEEIESLTDILEKRDEELEHAKIIATKAISQAQEIQNKYKQERNSRESLGKADMETKIESLNVSLEFLASKNEDLQKKNARLEAELREKTVRIARLKEERSSPGDYGPKENRGFVENGGIPSPSNESKSSGSSSARRPGSTRRSRSSPTKSRRKSRNGFKELDSSDAFSPFDEISSETSSTSKLDQHVAAQSAKVDSSAHHISSKSVGADFGQPSGWIADFGSDFDTKSDFQDARSEPGSAQSRREEIERDALRKYVRKRYLKHGESR